MPGRSSDMAKTSDDDLPDIKELNPDERLYYRDELRSARYAALADSEGFHEICFALESLGLRLYGRKAALGAYRSRLKQFSKDSVVLSELTQRFPSIFTQFDALFELVLTARNDAMHTGAYPIRLNVPQPTLFAAHKRWVAQQRGRAATKKDRDNAQAAAVFDLLKDRLTDQVSVTRKMPAELKKYLPARR